MIIELYALAGFQVGQCDENVVAGIELDRAKRHCSQHVNKKKSIRRAIVKHWSGMVAGSAEERASSLGRRDGPRAAVVVYFLTRRQMPKSLRITTKNAILAVGFLMSYVLFHNLDRVCVRCRNQTHGPVGANHQAVRSERFEGDIEVWDDLFRTPMIPFRLGN